MKTRELLSYIFIILITMFYTTNGALFFQEWMKNLAYIVLPIGICGIMLSFKSNIKSFWWAIVITVIIGFLFIKYSDTRMIVAVIGILACYSLDKQQVLSVLFYTKLFCFILVLLFGGYKHINGAALEVGVLLFLYICIKQSITLKHYVFLTLWYAVFSIYTRSGSFVVCVGIGLFLLVLCHFKVGKKICISKVIWFIYPICMFLNYFFAIGIGETEIPFVGKYLPDTVNDIYILLVDALEIFMSHRLSLTKYSLGKFGISLFGGNVDYQLLDLGTNGYFNLDSGYLWLLQGFGIIMTVFFLALTVLLMRYFSETQKYNFIIAGVVIALWSVNEDMLVGIGANFLLLYFGNVLDYGLKKGKEIL